MMIDRDTVIRLARECFIVTHGWVPEPNNGYLSALSEFAAAVEQMTIERCAKACESEWASVDDTDITRQSDIEQKSGIEACITAIRALLPNKET